jgi:hypothetical protein
MDYMEQSTLHIKAPHDVHIGAKVLAARRGISMNQLVVSLIEADMAASQLEPAFVHAGVSAARKASPAQKKIIKKAVNVMESLTSDIPNLVKASEVKPEKQCPRHHVGVSVCAHKH